MEKLGTPVHRCARCGTTYALTVRFCVGTTHKRHAAHPLSNAPVEYVAQPGAASVRARLKFPWGEEEIVERLIVGRNEDTPLGPRLESMDLLQVSGRHAEISIAGDKVFIRDLGSKNGTRRNGISIGSQPAELANNDEIAFSNQLQGVITIIAQ